MGRRFHSARQKLLICTTKDLAWQQAFLQTPSFPQQRPSALQSCFWEEKGGKSRRCLKPGWQNAGARHLVGCIGSSSAAGQCFWQRKTCCCAVAETEFASKGLRCSRLPAVRAPDTRKKKGRTHGPRLVNDEFNGAFTIGWRKGIAMH